MKTAPTAHADPQGFQRVEARTYHFPQAQLGAPPADTCSDEQLVQLAAEARATTANLYALLCSPKHVRRICELLVTCARELHACQVALDQERNAHQVTMLEREQAQDLYESELAERNRVAALHAELSSELARTRRQHGQVSAENVHLRHQLAGTTPALVQIALDRATRAITGRGYAEQTARLVKQLRQFPPEGMSGETERLAALAVADAHLVAAGLSAAPESATDAERRGWHRHFTGMDAPSVPAELAGWRAREIAASRMEARRPAKAPAAAVEPLPDTVSCSAEVEAREDASTKGDEP